MVRTLGDPFTIFLTPAEHKAFQESLTGIFEGYGFEVVQDSEKRFYFKNVLPGSPAESAGIENGGEVIKINGNELKNYQLSEVMQVLSDSAKSKIKLTFIGIKGLHDVEIKTEKFIVKTVKYQKLITKDNKQIAYIKVSRFGKNTINEWDAAVEKILNDKSVGVIVDLRDNLGGFPSVPIHIASEFIQKGPLYIDENNQGERKLVVVDKSGHLNNLPVVVLINKKSTSATELLASTIQFNKRGILVGEKSSGKGSIQNIYNLSDGSGLHVTVAKWFKPNGESVEKVGLIPDINVDQLGENINESDKTVQQAIKVLSN
jgi:carboxyl-terminal processing protease